MKDEMVGATRLETHARAPTWELTHKINERIKSTIFSSPEIASSDPNKPRRASAT